MNKYTFFENLTICQAVKISKELGMSQSEFIKIASADINSPLAFDKYQLQIIASELKTPVNQLLTHDYIGKEYQKVIKLHFC